MWIAIPSPTSDSRAASPIATCAPLGVAPHASVQDSPLTRSTHHVFAGRKKFQLLQAFLLLVLILNLFFAPERFFIRAVHTSLDPWAAASACRHRGRTHQGIAVPASVLSLCFQLRLLSARLLLCGERRRDGCERRSGANERTKIENKRITYRPPVQEKK